MCKIKIDNVFILVPYINKNKRECNIIIKNKKKKIFNNIKILQISFDSQVSSKLNFILVSQLGIILSIYNSMNIGN